MSSDPSTSESKSASSSVSDASNTPLIGPIYYQSPVDLRHSEVFFRIHQQLSTHGKNTGSVFNSFTLNYDVPKDVKVTFQANGRKYRLVEYHFHDIVGSEHAIDGKKTDAELHYVFVQIDDDCAEGKAGQAYFKQVDPKDPSCACNLCGGQGVEGRTISCWQDSSTLRNGLHETC